MHDGLSTSERELAERFRALAERELPRLYALARRLVPEEAEDLVQETLLRAYRSFARLESDEAARTWLTRILVNCCRDHWRARGRRVEEIELDEADEFSLFRKIADEDPFPYSDSVHLDFLQQFGTDDVRAVLAGLPELYRVPLVLVHMAGYHVKEVAHVLEVPLGTMLARLHRGRKLFERELWRYAEENGLLKAGGRA
ncbi:MAG TPA: sigma-70 family RNA polymerase sigma factor [Gaiellaceae bacterium]|nr:sigma-70 family RNA polymerase sigma factor [Gaiellaceae bacterium]